MSRASYSPGALHTVTLKATEHQKSAWTVAAKQMGMGGPGPFLAFAADLYLAMFEAYAQACERYDRELQGAKYR